MSHPQVRVGVGVFILQSPTPEDNKNNPTFLLGTRKGSHGHGTLQLPGGHLEFSESFQECAVREVLEETGLQVTFPEFLTCTNDFMETEGKHYVTIFMVCRRLGESQEARVLEPEKCGGWRWCTWEELTRLGEEKDGTKLFLPLMNLLEQRSGIVPSLPSTS